MKARASWADNELVIDYWPEDEEEAGAVASLYDALGRPTYLMLLRAMFQVGEGERQKMVAVRLGVAKPTERN